MKIKNKRALIISLIKDDLINTKLIDGLEALGLDALEYHLHLSENVFELFGFEDNETTDKIFENYLSELKKAKGFNIRGSRNDFDALSVSIYNELERRKSNGK